LLPVSVLPAVFFKDIEMKTKILFSLFIATFFTVQAQVVDKPTYLNQMNDILKGVPSWWKTGLDDVEKTVAGVKKGKVEQVCLSAGGRPVYRIFYGKPNDVKSTASLSSAMGAGNMKYYADKSSPDYRPTLFLAGAVHAGELEGVAALVNLVSVFETGKDLAGKTYPYFTAIFEKMNFIIILIANPDGRARMPLPSMMDLDFESFRYLGQGTWKDGTLTGYPSCKQVHPIKDAAGFLGSYFNDDGVNLMHDNFFTNPSAETKAVLQTAETFAPDFSVLFHGGSNNKPHMAGSCYLFQPTKAKINAFQQFIADEYKAYNFSLGGEGVNDRSNVFNLTSAISQVSGEPAITFESNQGLNYTNEKEPWLVKYTYDEIYLHHILSIEGLCKFVMMNR